MPCRRLIAGAAAGLGLLLAAPNANADGAQWNKSRITTPASVTNDSFVISAEFYRASNNLTGGSMNITTSFTTPSGLRPQCGSPGTVPLTTDFQGNPNEQPWWSTAPHSVECNGTYSFEVVATFSRPLSGDDVKRLPGSITVNAPPPEVRNVKAALEAGTVVLTWSAVSDPPPDLVGYRVERQEPSGKYTTIASLGTSATTFTDSSPPPEGGEVIYRVLALREGPNGDVASDGGGRSNPVDLPVPTTTVPGAPTDGGATDGGTGGTAGTGDGTTAGTAGETTGGTRATPRFDTTRGRTGVGTRAPRLGIDTGSRSGLLLEPPDEGFDEEIDYGQLPGGEDESLGDDLLVFDEGSGRGLAVPIGIGAVLMGWGLHLFFLARAARPAMMTVPVDDYDAYEPVYEDPEPDPWSSGGPYGTSYGGSTYGTRYPSHDTYDQYETYDLYER